MQKKKETDRISFSVLELRTILKQLSSKKYAKVRQKIRQKLDPFLLPKKKYDRLIETGLSVEERANVFREHLIKEQTEPEKRFKIILKELGIEYTFQNIFFYKTKAKKPKPKFYVLDFYLPKYSLAIELDGRYHNELEQKRLDRERTSLLNESGIRVLRIPNFEIKDDIETVKIQILTYLQQYIKTTDEVKVVEIRGIKYKKRLDNNSHVNTK
jgi:very-short-patch-repair endonuclease